MASRAHTGEIVATSIRKQFGSFVALDDVSLRVEGGEFLTLLGPSGSGKTTFLMILAGFEPVTSGQLILDGRDITREMPEQRAFGIVFQGYALFPHMSVRDNIAFPLRVQRRSSDQIRRRVDEMIAITGLEGHGHKRPAALSGGQQQRVALARALAFEPQVLLLDEPFSALDKNLRAQMQDEVRRLHREIGTTFVFVTHDQSEALALSSHIAIFDQGRLQQVGTPNHVYERPANRFCAEFLGDINIMTVTDLDQDGSGTIGGAEVRCAAAPKPGATCLAVRPEHMSLHLSDPGGPNAVAARVADMTYLGADMRLNLEGPGGIRLDLTQPAATLPAGLAPDTQVWTRWPEDRGFFL